MVSLQPCGLVLAIIILIILVSWIAARSWSRGFALAYEGCQLGAFDDTMSNDTYSSEGLAYASKNPAPGSAVNKILTARQLAKSRGGEGFVYKNSSEIPSAKNANAYQRQREGFTSFDYIIPDIAPSPALGAATPTSPFVGHL